MWQPSATVDAAGRFRIGPLPAGLYRVQGSVGGDMRRRSAWSEPFALAAHTTGDLGVIAMPATGTIAVTARGPDGKPLDGNDVALEDNTGFCGYPWLVGKLADGKALIADVAPGSYRLRVNGRELPNIYRAVTVRAEQETRAEIAVPAGVPVQLQVAAVTEGAPIHVTWLWTRDGAFHERYVNWVEGIGGFAWPVRLLPGSYEIAITSETGKRAVNCFTIGPDDPPDRAIAIRQP
jgi:hypothetical protein